MCLNKQTNVSCVTAGWPSIKLIKLVLCVRRPSFLPAASLVGTFVGGGRLVLELVIILWIFQKEFVPTSSRVVLCGARSSKTFWPVILSGPFGGPFRLVNIFDGPINGDPLWIGCPWGTIFWRSKPGSPKLEASSWRYFCANVKRFFIVCLQN